MWPFYSHKSRQLKTARRARSSFRPRLEALEDRTLLSAYMVTTTADSGPGSLRDAINQINADANHALYFSPSNPAVDEIDFAVGVATIAPQSALPSVTDSVVIDGGASLNTNSVTTNGQSNDNASRPITLDGAAGGASFDGLTIAAGNSTVKGLTIQNFNNDIHLVGAGNDVITGNYLSSAADGVFVDGVSNNTIGGAAPAARNLLVFATDEIRIQGVGATGNLVEGNYIGTDGVQQMTVSPTFLRTAGVFVLDASSNTIGGTAPGSGNVIDSDLNGIIIGGESASANDNLVQGNYIGTNPTGTAFLTDANSLQGIWVEANANGNTIGGPTGGTTGVGRNVISGYEFNLVIQSFGVGGTGNLVEGNYIGTDATGTYSLNNPASFPNVGNLGVYTENVTATVIGGLTPGSGNLISGNPASGLELFGTGDLVEGNLIGTDFTGKNPLLNGPPNGPGVVVAGTESVIGGTALGAGNTIAYNLGDGVDAAGTGARIEGNSIAYNQGTGVAATGTGIRIEDNSIYGNGFLGIDLGGPIPGDPHGTELGVGVTLNGSENLPGPNNWQYFPTLTSAASSSSSTSISGSFSEPAEPNLSITLDFYANSAADPTGYGQGQTYLGSTTVTTDVSGAVVFTADLAVGNLAGQWITATATDPNGDTSEFDLDVQATAAPTQTFSQYLQSVLPQTASEPAAIAIQTGPDLTESTVISAVNALTAPPVPVIITLNLNGGTYSDATVDPPANVTLIINGASGSNTFVGHSPAFTVTGGNVIVQNVTFSTATDAPTILVTGGSLTLRNDIIQESTGYRDAAISVTGGTVDLGTATPRRQHI
jgi:trimeric autotransporter adhesin